MGQRQFLSEEEKIIVRLLLSFLTSLFDLLLFEQHRARTLVFCLLLYLFVHDLAADKYWKEVNVKVSAATVVTGDSSFRYERLPKER